MHELQLEQPIVFNDFIQILDWFLVTDVLQEWIPLFRQFKIQFIIIAVLFYLDVVTLNIGDVWDVRWDGLSFLIHVLGHKCEGGWHDVFALTRWLIK